MCVSYVAPKFHIVLSIVGSISGVIMQVKNFKFFNFILTLY